MIVNYRIDCPRKNQGIMNISKSNFYLGVLQAFPNNKQNLFLHANKLVTTYYNLLSYTPNRNITISQLTRLFSYLALKNQFGVDSQCEYAFAHQQGNVYIAFSLKQNDYFLYITALSQSSIAQRMNKLKRILVPNNSSQNYTYVAYYNIATNMIELKDPPINKVEELDIDSLLNKKYQKLIGDFKEFSTQKIEINSSVYYIVVFNDIGVMVGIDERLLLEKWITKKFLCSLPYFESDKRLISYGIYIEEIEK